MKHWLLLVLALFLSVPSFADWSLSADGVLTVTSDYDYGSSSQYPWHSQRSKIKSVVIADGVSKIGRRAFSGLISITSIKIPSSVMVVSEWAFSGCYHLRNVVMEDGLRSIKPDAFHDCGIQSVNIPASVSEVSGRSFRVCGNIKSISVDPNNPKYNSRGDCNAIIETATNTLVVGSNNTDLSVDVEYIGEYAFHSRNFTNDVIQIPASCRSIGQYAFAEAAIQSVEFPEDLESIGDFAFKSCGGLGSVFIPRKVKELGTGVFAYCHEISSMAVDPANAIYDSRNGCNAIMDSHDNSLVAGCKSSDVPADVVSLADYSFAGCSDLDYVSFPDGLTSIGSHAFADCSNLNNVSLPETLNHIGEFAFDRCFSIESIDIPWGVTKIQEATFEECTSLSSLTLPDDLMSIGNNAFYLCENLLDFDLPLYLNEIGDFAFMYCEGLQNLRIHENVNSISSEAYRFCRGLESISVDGGNIFYDSREDCNAIVHTNSNTIVRGCVNTVIPSDVTAIGDYAFASCDFSKVVIPDNVTSIGICAYEDCQNLRSVEIHKDVAFIGDAAFYDTRVSEVTSYVSSPFFAAIPFPEGATIHIPAGTTSLYEAAWGEDYNYVEMGPAVVEYVVTLTATVGGTVSGAGTYASGSEVTISATPAPGYAFVGWSDGVSDPVRTETVTADIDLEAIFTVIGKTFTVYADIEGDGTVEGVGEYAAGSLVTVSAVPSPGYFFITWGDGIVSRVRQFFINEDTYLFASFYNKALTAKPDVHVSVTNGIIRVEGAESYMVYDLSGRLVSTTESLPAGLYVVVVGAESYKVIVK